MKKITSILIALMGLVHCLSARDIYVAKNGSDSNDGSLENPYLTIQKAAQVAQAGDIVYIREGTYEETLMPTNSGVEGNPIVFQSYSNEKVIITTMQELSGWESDSGDIYKTKVDWTLGQKNFVMNGATACDLARWPNNTDGDPFTQNSLRNTGGTTGDVAINAKLEYSEGIPNHNWGEGGSLYFYGDKPGSGWTTWRAFIKASDATSVTFDLNKNPDWIRTAHAPSDLGDFFLQGTKGALDYQNEWFFDEKTKELYIMLPDGEKPVDGQIKMRKREIAINLEGKSNIEIKNLAVFGGSVLINGDNNKLFGVTSLYGNYTLGVVTGFYAESESVSIKGKNNIINKCEIGFGAGTGIWDRGMDTQILNSYLHDFNYLGNYDAIIMVREGEGTRILNNTITRAGRDCIQSVGNNVIVAYNDISYSNFIADDCGLFYTLGGPKNSEVHHNWFHDAYAVKGKNKAAAIYLDNDTDGYSVHHNVVWNTDWTGIQINWNGKNIDIFNNTFWNNSEVMGAWHKEGTAFSNVRVWNNIANDENWEPQSDKQNNISFKDGEDPFIDLTNWDFRPSTDAEIIDAGKEIDGITDNFVGDAPEIGAYEEGDHWVPGIDWDPKLGPAGLGCYGLPGEDCYTNIGNDDDNDGVENDKDQCPNTPEGKEVDEHGCVKILSSDDQLQGNILLYPNPVKDKLNVRLPNANVGFCTWEIYSISGQYITANNKQVSDTEISIPLPDLNSGIYLLRISYDQSTYLIKFIK